MEAINYAGLSIKFEDNYMCVYRYDEVLLEGCNQYLSDDAKWLAVARLITAIYNQDISELSLGLCRYLGFMPADGEGLYYPNEWIGEQKGF